MIKAVLIDDELIALQGLCQKLSKHCPQVKVLQIIDRPAEAVDAIKSLAPDVVFLDIEMPRLNGFNLLAQLQPVQFEVIFTTAYEQYAIDALRASALDFLLKPIDKTALVKAVERLEKKLAVKTGLHERMASQLEIFLGELDINRNPKKIALPVLNGLVFVDLSSIVKVFADNVYTTFYLSDGSKLVVSRTLKEIEKVLCQFHFIRVHKSSIINLNFISHYIKGEGGTVVLSDGSEVEISRRCKQLFLERVAKS